LVARFHFCYTRTQHAFIATPRYCGVDLEPERRAMSLASRIANIFTPGQATQFAPSGSHESTVPFTITGHGDSKNTSLHSGKRKEYAEPLEEEEEARPPYLHVRYSSAALSNYTRADDAYSP